MKNNSYLPSVEGDYIPRKRKTTARSDGYSSTQKNYNIKPKTKLQNSINSAYTSPSRSHRPPRPLPPDPIPPARPAQSSDFVSIFQVVANRFGLGHALDATHLCHEFRLIVQELWPQNYSSIPKNSNLNSADFHNSKTQQKSNPDSHSEEKISSDSFIFPIHFQNSILTVGVVNSLWAHQIQQQKHQILDRLNQKFGPTCVEKISIRQVDSPPLSTDQY